MSKRENGIYYTPSVLAEFLAEPLITSDISDVLDPSYGEGALLLAAEKIHKRKERIARIDLYGCDIKPVNGLLKHLPEANLKNIDFFDFSTDNKFELLLMNPPYVRHHYLDGEKLEKSKRRWPILNLVSNSADLWAYFIVKAGEHLRENGNIGAILPWSFLQADYAKDIRLYLNQKFEEIKILCLSDKYFDEADERVVLLWLKKYGKVTKSISIASSKGISDPIEYKDLPIEYWGLKKVPYTANSAIELLESFKNDYGFAMFNEYADVRIGVVTAGNKYFIRQKEELKEYGIGKGKLKPILVNSKQLQDYLKNGKKNLKSLVYLSRGDYNPCRKFIVEGIKKGMDKTAHAMNRKPWYQVKIGSVPDAFFPYRMSQTPYLVFNKQRVLCTNSIHKIYFKKLNFTQAKWLQVSLLSDIGQLSLEVNAKTYGKGVLKIEPSSLKSALIYISSDKAINATHAIINNYLKQNKKAEARQVATEFITNYLNIPKAITDELYNAIKEFEVLRNK